MPRSGGHRFVKQPRGRFQIRHAKRVFQQGEARAQKHFGRGGVVQPAAREQAGQHGAEAELAGQRGGGAVGGDEQFQRVTGGKPAIAAKKRPSHKP